MTTPGDTATPRPTFDPYALTTWALSSLADCASPDRPDRYGWGHDVTGETFDPSPGAELLRSVARGVAEAIEYAGDDLDPERPDDVNDSGAVDQIADGAPCVYTATRWAEFVDLGAYNEDGDDLGGFPSDLTDAAGVALYMIAERLAWALLREYAGTLAEWIAEHEDAEGYWRAPEPATVAVVYNDDGTVYDRCYTWQAGQNYAMHEGRRVVAVADDAGVTIEEAQRLYDSELAAHLDCWGGPLHLTGGES